MPNAVGDDLIRNYFHALMEVWIQSLKTPLEKFRFLSSLAATARLNQLALSQGQLTEEEREDIILTGLQTGKLTADDADDREKSEAYIQSEAQNYFAQLYSSGGARELHAAKKDLTDDSLKGNNSAVKSELEKLIARVKRLASRPGAKAELARVLKVAPARVTEWLTDDKEKRKEPGGHYTLQLLKWVEQQERQK